MCVSSKYGRPALDRRHLAVDFLALLVVPFNPVRCSPRFCYLLLLSKFQVESLWVNGRYDPEGDTPATAGLGSVGISIVGSQVCVGRARGILHNWLLFDTGGGVNLSFAVAADCY